MTQGEGVGHQFQFTTFEPTPPPLRNTPLLTYYSTGKQAEKQPEKTCRTRKTRVRKGG